MNIYSKKEMVQSKAHSATLSRNFKEISPDSYEVRMW